MMNIAICMGNIKENGEIEKLLNRFSDKNQRLGMRVYIYTTGSELLAACAGIYIILMDVALADMSGIEAAEQLRAAGNGAEIIFITSSRRHALDAYRVRALQYLLKPVEEERFFEAMNKAVLLANHRVEGRFVLNTAEGMRRLPMSNILYLRSDKHIVHAYLKNGQEVVSRNLRVSFGQLIQPLVQTGQFIHTHQSYVVNINYIDRLTADGLILTNETIIPVSYSKHDQVKSLWKENAAISSAG